MPRPIPLPLIQPPSLRNQTHQNNANNAPDHLYLDLSMYNIETDPAAAPPIVNLTSNVESDILKNASEWYLSITRFSIQTANSIPQFLATIQDGISQTDRNLMVNSFTMSFTDGSGNNVQYQQFWEWVPQNTAAALPAPPSLNNGKQDVAGVGPSESYYYAFTKAWLIYIMNNAIAACYDGLVAAAATASITLPAGSSQSPFILFDNQTQNVTMYFNTAQFNDQSGNDCNAPAYSLLATLPFEIQPYVGITNGKNFRILINPFANNSGSTIIQTPFFDPDPSNNCYFVSTENSPVSLWSPVSSIKFCSNQLRVQPNLALPIALFNKNVLFTSSGYTTTSNVITDFIADDLNFGQTLIYTPQYLGRLIDLTGDLSIRNVDIQAYWTTQQGVDLPIRLPSGCGASMKIMFLKKDSNWA